MDDPHRPPELSTEYFLDNFWFEAAGLHNESINPPLKGRQLADIAIVGGGFTGMSAAYNLAAPLPGQAHRAAGGRAAAAMERAGEAADSPHVGTARARLRVRRARGPRRRVPTTTPRLLGMKADPGASSQHARCGLRFRDERRHDARHRGAAISRRARRGFSSASTSMGIAPSHCSTGGGAAAGQLRALHRRVAARPAARDPSTPPSWRAA